MEIEITITVIKQCIPYTISFKIIGESSGYFKTTKFIIIIINIYL